MSTVRRDVLGRVAVEVFRHRAATLNKAAVAPMHTTRLRITMTELGLTLVCSKNRDFTPPLERARSARGLRHASRS